MPKPTQILQDGERFFRDFELDYLLIAKAIVRIMDLQQPWVVSTETEWSFGKTRFNILILGIVHNGVAYPLVWEMLETPYGYEQVLLNGCKGLCPHGFKPRETVIKIGDIFVY